MTADTKLYRVTNDKGRTTRMPLEEAVEAAMTAAPYEDRERVRAAIQRDGGAQLRSET
jgi:hypothetical protein